MAGMTWLPVLDRTDAPEYLLPVVIGQNRSTAPIPYLVLMTELATGVFIEEFISQELVASSEFYFSRFIYNQNLTNDRIVREVAQDSLDFLEVFPKHGRFQVLLDHIREVIA